MPPPPSYSALVASYDPACVRYTAVATAQPATNELISTFKPMVIELLKRFYTKNRLYPQSIIFFRDGIAESQISSFMQSEVKALRGKSPIVLAIGNAKSRNRSLSRAGTGKSKDFCYQLYQASSYQIFPMSTRRRRQTRECSARHLCRSEPKSGFLPRLTECFAGLCETDALLHAGRRQWH